MQKKVSLVRCESYDYGLVKKAMKKSIDNIGGFDKYIKKGEKVLLKPNLVMKKKPEDMSTTHPAVVKALCELLTEFGAHVIIGDSPGGPFNELMLSGIYKATGMETVASEAGVRLNYNFKSVKRKNPDGLLLKEITITDMLNDVDKVISVSKLKTHGMMTFTGAVKNMFGIIPGLLKAEYHFIMPKKDDFANALVDICIAANPVLSFMDGVVGMEGEGPTAGEPRAINVLIASDSPYHLDKAACEIIGLPFDEVSTIKNCIKRGLCTKYLDDVDLIGDDIEDFKIDDFDIPKVTEYVELVRGPKFLKRFVNSVLRPVPAFKDKVCTVCGICVDRCPAKVITIKKGKDKPILNTADCIRCYCCHELCPNKAIAIKDPIISKLAFWRKSN
ncbi:MAG: DUF362 domain-containing protein [Defluviitaleaceae bacterium]|nr:DUF362 domain-containing protein [Defluviitaleaceae bacterium]